MRILDMVQAAKNSIKSRSSVPTFMVRLDRLRAEERAPEATLMVDYNWDSWVAYMQKLKGENKLSRNSYNTLSQKTNSVAWGLKLLIEAPVNGPDVWTIIPILNKERTDMKEIVVASPATSSIKGPFMEVARWRQDDGKWKFEGNIDRETWKRLVHPPTSVGR